MTKIETIIADAAETLSKVECLRELPVIEEDKGDVSKNLEAALAKTRFAVVVGWNGFAPRIVGDTAPSGRPFGTATIAVSLFEKPVVNRTNASAPTILAVAREVAVALDNAGTDEMEDLLHLKRITPISELDRGVVSCDVEFETSATL